MPTPPKYKPNLFPESSPDYSRSLVTQQKGSPTAAGAVRGVEAGALGAILSALIAKMVGASTPQTLAAAGVGGAAAGTLGAVSGYRDRESKNTRLLALRRLGVQTPAELEFAHKYPSLVGRLTGEGFRL